MLNDKVNIFLKNAIGDFQEVRRLEGDASTREYFRVFSSNKTYILCMDRNFSIHDASAYPFLVIYNLFINYNIKVPEVLSYNNELGVFLLEDAGDYLLESIFDELSSYEKERVYSSLVETIVNIQTITGEPDMLPFNLCFDKEKLLFEFDFFIEHALKKYFRVKLSQGDVSLLLKEFISIAEILYRPEFFVLNHRDFHSRNVLLYNDSLYIIDFQDARMGLPLYDLVSLLRDSYLQLGTDQVDKLKILHFDLLREQNYSKMSFDEFNYFFDIMAFQRNVKALGTFGYQVTTLKRNRFENYIQRTINYLDDYISRQKVLGTSGRLILEWMRRDE